MLRPSRRRVVVAAVHSGASLEAALALADLPAAPDTIELRLDGFTQRPGSLDAFVTAAVRPFIVTARHPAEGGLDAGLVDPARRLALYERFLPAAAMVDIELQFLGDFREIVDEARRSGVGIVASFHDFREVPAPVELRTLAARAVDAGADIFKLAATVERPAQLARLLEWVGVEDRIPLAVMGMGTLGKLSRLAFAATGSVLNYGYIGDAPQVPGQWPAALLRERIDEFLD